MAPSSSPSAAANSWAASKFLAAATVECKHSDPFVPSNGVSIPGVDHGVHSQQMPYRLPGSQASSLDGVIGQNRVPFGNSQGCSPYLLARAANSLRAYAAHLHACHVRLRFLHAANFRLCALFQRHRVVSL